jgi:glycosyltransferase involved in cell wall biosynthesis
MSKRAVWITWQRHRRTRELCRAFGLELLELTWRGRGIVRYPLLAARTALFVCRERPAVVFIQCPSVLLGVWAVLLKRVFRFVLVADLHNEAVEPYNYSFAAYRRALAWIGRSADVCLVTNDALKQIVERGGGRAFVLPDKVPDLHPAAGGDAADALQVVFVCSYAPDEPYLEVIEAAGLLDRAVTVHVTGDHRRLPETVQVPPNVRLTGYLSEQDYEDLLRGADIVVDLTRMENCLVCGAYEAVAVERPLVTSDTRALRAYFNRGTVYTAHTVQSLASAIAYALRERRRLAAEMKLLKAELARDWARQGDGLRRLVGLT